MTRRPTILAFAYLGLATVWQIAQFDVLPNVGMGGLAITYLVWPLIALSAIGLWFALRRYVEQQSTFVVLASVLMLVGCLALHPQDSQTSLPDKMKRMVAAFAGH